MSRKLAECLCPACGEMLDGSTGVGKTGEDELPAEGDISICAFCAVPLVFDRKLKVRRMTKAEIRELPFGMKLHLSHLKALILLAKAMRPEPVKKRPVN